MRTSTEIRLGLFRLKLSVYCLGVPPAERLPPLPAVLNNDNIALYLAGSLK